MERIYLKEAIEQLDYKDMRSLKRWCANHCVGILSDIGSKKRFLIKEEFEEAKEREPKMYLSQKYGRNDFSEVFDAHSKFFVEYKTVMEEKNKQQLTGYKPQGEFEKSFLAHLTRKLAEL